MTSNEIIEAVYAELTRLHGENYTRHCTLFYQHSWFYLSLPIQQKSRLYTPDPILTPYRKAEILAWLEELRSQ